MMYLVRALLSECPKPSGVEPEAYHMNLMWQATHREIFRRHWEAREVQGHRKAETCIEF